MPSLLALTHSRTDPASRFRVIQFIPALEAAGWQVRHRPCSPPRDQGDMGRSFGDRLAGVSATLVRRWRRRLDLLGASRFDVVWASRDVLEGDPRWEDRFLAVNPRYLLDFDDAVYLTDRRGHFPRVCARAAWVVAGNETLAAEARRHTSRVSVIPTVVDTREYRVSRAGAGAGLRVGWCGSALSIRQTLVPFLPLLTRLQTELGFRFTVITRPRPELRADGLVWDHVDWSPEVETRLGDWLDVGIMPLGPEPYLAAKCACKLLQYLACGLPAVGTPAGVSGEILSTSGAGIAATNEAEWAAALAELRDPAARERLGPAGRRYVEEKYSLERWFPALQEVLLRVSGAPERGAGPGGVG